jgi:hypothetical protein
MKGLNVKQHTTRTQAKGRPQPQVRVKRNTRKFDRALAADRIYRQVLVERAAQDQVWSEDYTDSLFFEDWRRLFDVQLSNAVEAWSRPDYERRAPGLIADVRQCLINTAALAFAAIESLDREGNITQ